MDLTIRKMKPDDFDIIMKIFDETDFGCVGIKELFKPEKQSQMFMMREVLRGEATDEKFLVVELNNKVVGYATIQETPANWHIGQFAIDKQYRRQGIGKNFMEILKDMAKKCRKNISLECYEKDNLFFLKQGFNKTKEDEIETEYRWEFQKKKERNIDEK